MTAYLGRPTGSNVHWVWNGSNWGLLPYGGGSSSGSVVTASITVTQIHTFTGTTASFVVPEGVTSFDVKMWGPGGGGGAYSSQQTAGAGGFTSGTILTTPGEQFLLIVGGGGLGVTGASGIGGLGGYGNGGTGSRGDASGGGGGGYSGIFTSSILQSNAILIAGGGGGSSGYRTGGGGGGQSGGNASVGGAGGTQTAGGGGGVTGGRLFGANGFGDRLVSTVNDDAGGGSGYWGGGASSGDGAGGGGGSGFIHSSLLRVINSGTLQGNGGGTNIRATPPMNSDIDYLTIISSSAALTAPPFAVGSGGGVGQDGGHGAILIRYTVGQNTALWYEDDPNTAFITSSVAIGITGSAQTKGADNFVYISGTIGLSGSLARKAVFGGDTFTSGSTTSAFGFSGSLTRLPGGQSYITASDGISITSASNGQVGIGLASRLFAYDLDFTLLASLSLSNGANTIDGKTWQGSNSGAASTFDILSGTGLRLFNNTTNSDYNNGTRTAPILEARITDFYPDYDPGKHRVRFWVQFTHTADQNFETARIGFERSGSETTQNFQTGRQFNGGNLWFSTTTSTATSTAFSDSTDTTHDVGVVEFFNYSEMVSLSGLYSGSDWPASNQLKIRNRASQFNINGGIKSPSDLAVFVCSSTTNTNGNMQMVVKKIRIEIR